MQWPSREIQSVSSTGLIILSLADLDIACNFRVKSSKQFSHRKNMYLGRFGIGTLTKDQKSLPPSVWGKVDVFVDLREWIG